MGLSRGGARSEIEAKSKFIKKLQLEKDEGRRKILVSGFPEAGFCCIEKLWMRIALRKNLQERGKCCNPGQRQRIVQDARGSRFGQFNRINPKLIVEACPPLHLQAVSRLQKRAYTPGAATLHKAASPAVGTREDVCDHAAFAVRPPAEKDAVVSPSHDALPLG
jgi:hypothetical protein